jgi:hypothetical protein
VQSGGKGAVVQHVQRAADWDTLTNTRNRDAGRTELIGQPMRCGGSVNRGTQGKNHLRDIALLDPVEQARHIQILGTNAGYGGQSAAQDVIEAMMDTRALERPEVADPFDDANDGAISMFVQADGAGILTVEVAAIATLANSLGSLRQRGGERQHAGPRLLQHPQGGAPSATRPHAWQLGEQVDQMIEFGAQFSEIHL